MSRNHIKRAQQRRPRAAFEARKRKAEDPWQRYRQVVRDLVDEGKLYPACIKVADALAERHQENGHKAAQLPVFVGYGPVEAWERQHHRPGVLPPLSVMTGLDRRTVMRCIAQMVELGILRRQYGDGREDDVRPVEVVSRRERYWEGGRWHYRPVGPVRIHMIGRGGCDKGGLGIANCYWVEGTPGPEHDPEPPPPSPPAPDPPPSGARPWKPLRDHLGPDPRARGP